MANKVIEIASLEEFDDQLSIPDRVFFLVLGNGEAHQELVESAHKLSTRWRYTLWAKDPSPLYPRLFALPLRPGVLKIVEPWPTRILAVSISNNNYICRVVTTYTGNVVSPAFMLAETFLQP